MMDTKKLLNGISKLNQDLIKKSEEYREIKTKYLNNFKIVEYLFNKPTKKIFTSNDIDLDYNNTVKSVYLDPDHVTHLDVALDDLAYTLYEYNRIYNAYTNYVKEYIKITKSKPLFPKINYLPHYSELSNKVRIINDILDKIRDYFEKKDTCKMSCVYKWTFITEGEHHTLSQKIPINFTNDLVYDFFGQIIYDDKLILFVIDYVDKIAPCNQSASWRQDKEDYRIGIMKQHMLYQMNIHLLRLNKKSDLQAAINHFIGKIMKTNDYVIMNKLDFDVELFGEVNEELLEFVNEYELNHVAYLKNPRKKTRVREDDDDDDDELDKEPADEKSVVDKNMFKKLVSRKMYLGTDNKFIDKNERLVRSVWRDKIREREEENVRRVQRLINGKH